MMTVTWVSGGQTERIPEIGSRLEIEPHVLFQVEAYGNSISEEVPTSISKTGILYTLELKGHLVVPAGSPLDVLARILNGEVGQ